METDNSCIPCSRENQLETATKWCSDCEEGLCTDCSKAHRKNKLTVDHSLIDANLVSSLPFGLIQSHQRCNKHPEFYVDLVCTDHDQLCCRACMLQHHRTCNVVLPIQTASKIVKRSCLSEQLSKESKHVTETIDKIVHFGQTNLQNLEVQEEDISTEISSVRSTFLSKIEDVEVNITKKLERTLRTNEVTIMDYKEEVKKIREAAVIYRQEIDFINKYASENKAFLLIERLKCDLHRDTMAMRNLSSNVENFKLVYKDTSDFAIKSVGRITVENEPCPIKYEPTSLVLERKISYTDTTNPEPDDVYKENVYIDLKYEYDNESIYEDIDKIATARAKEPSYVISTGPHFNLSSSEFRFEYQLHTGTGKSKDLWKAMYKQTTQVAVKQFKKGEKNLRIQQLLEIDHDNIIRFYGTFSDKENIGLVFDFMTNVDLFQYLHIKEGLELPKTELLSIAAQVARGMSHLESKNIVHCGLQARKILIGEDGEVKVSGLEYGTIEKVIALYPYNAINSDELTFQKHDVIAVIDREDIDWWEGELNGKTGFFPVGYVSQPEKYINLDERLFKWYSIETLQSGRCNIKSNVWSYGILFIEIITRGQIPYSGIQNTELYSKLKQGYRHPRPSECSEALYRLMLKCWDDIPDNRPKFQYLYNNLEDLVYDL